MDGQNTILIVEDESIVAHELGSHLERCGYRVCGTCASGAEAIQLAEDLRPSLLLVDIVLKGEMDGIEAVRTIRSRMDIPVIYLTAHADEATVERAKKTEPYGYILKPFQAPELKSMIETALYKHEMEKELRASEQKFRNIIDQLADGIGVTDESGILIEWNQSMERTTGLRADEVLGRPIWDVQLEMNLPEEQTNDARQSLKDAISRMLKDGVAPFAEKLLERDYDHPDGTKRLIQGTVFPIKTGKGFMLGSLSRDVTEERQLVDRLRANLEQTKLILETTMDGYILADNEGQILDVNPAYCRMIGYSKKQLLKMNIREVEVKIPPEEVDRRIKQMIKAGKDRFETNHRRKDGTILDLEVSVSIMQSDGTALVAAFVRDISERKRAENALLESEARFKDTQKMAHLGNWYWEVKTGKVEWSDEVYRIFGLDPKTFVPEIDSVMERFHPDDRKVHEDVLANAIKNRREYSFEPRLILPDGSIRYVYSTSKGHYDDEGELLAISGFVQDITQRRQTEMDLRDSEASLQRAQAIAHMGSWEFDVARNEIAWSDELYRIFGMEPQEIKLTNETLLNRVHPDYRDYHIALAKKLDEVGKADFEYPLVRPDGEVRWVSGQGETVFDEKGKPVKRFGTVQDITERKQAEEKIKFSEANLKSLIDNREDFIWSLDRNYCYVVFNSAFADMFYLQHKKTLKKGYSMLEFMPEEVKEFWARLCERAFKGEHVKFEYPYDLGRGIKHFQASINPIVEEGEITGLSFISIDITERVKSAERFKALFEHSPVPLWEEDFSEVKKIIDTLKKRRVKNFRNYFDKHPEVVDKCIEAVKILDVNNHVLDLYEASTKAELFKGLSKIFTDDSVKAFKEELIAIAENRSECEFDAKVKTLKNKEKYIHLKWAIVPGYEETLERIYIATADITERKKAEEALRRSEELHREAQNTAHIAHWTFVPVTGISWWSEELYKIYGLNPADGPLMYEEHPKLIHPDDWQRVDVTFRDSVEKGIPYDIIFRILRPDGSERILNAICNPVTDDTGAVVQMRGTIQDITLLKETEEDLWWTQHMLTEAQRIAKIGSWEWDIATNKVTWSDAMFPVFGLEPQEPTYDLVKSLIHPEEVNWWENYLVEMLEKSRASFNIDYRIIRPDGNIAWLHNEAEVLRNDNGEPVRMIGTTQDVTDRKQAEEAIKESEEKYRSLFEQASDGIFLLDEQNLAMDLNTRACEMLGYSKEELLATNIAAMIHPDDIVGKDHEGAMAALLKGETVQSQYRLRKKDGSFVPTELSTKMLGEGRFLNIVRDISERVQAEVAIRENERRLATLMSNLPGMAYRCRNEMDWTMEFVSDGAQALTGYTPSDLVLNQTIAYGNVIEAEDRQRVWDRIQASLNAHEPFEMEYRITTKRKEVKTVWERGIGVYDETGALTALEGFISDVTGQKEAERALRESEERFRAMFEQAAVGVAQIASKTGEFIRLNQRYADIVGYTVEEMGDHNFQEITHPGDLQADLDNMQKLLDGSIREFSMEKRYVHKQGSLVWVNLTVSPLWEVGEEPEYHIAVVEDITERKDAEDRIKASLEEKEVLLKEIHHRVKNNMQVIKSLVNLQVQYLDDQRSIGAFKEIANRIQSMALVHEKLYHSHDLSNIDMADYLKDLVIRLMSVLSVEVGRIRVETNVKNILLSIDIAIPVGLLITELLTNAMKHAFPDNRRGVIRINFVREKSVYMLTIQDDGVGFEPEIKTPGKKSMGFTLIDALVAQLEASMKISGKEGTTFVIKFSERE